MSYYFQWRPYVSVAQRRAQAQREMQKLKKKGKDIQPVVIEGRKIAKTFWGEAWCDHMEEQGDFENRLPRGRTYVRNGSVCHLSVQKGKIDACVSGSEMYKVAIKIDVLSPAKWKNVKQRCSGQIGSLLELLQGRISSGVMEVVTDPKNGLFPLPKEIHLDCNCPDYATMCKHAAAVLYGVGARLDQQPELLFLLRGVNHLDLIAAGAEEAVAQATERGGGRRQVAGDLADVFGIELDEETPPTESNTASRPKKASCGAVKPTARPRKKAVKKAKRPAAATAASPVTTASVIKRAAKKDGGAETTSSQATVARLSESKIRRLEASATTATMSKPRRVKKKM